MRARAHTHTQSRVCFTKSKESESGRAQVTVEVKVLVIAFSYIIIGLVATTSFAISSARIESLKEELFVYFQCELCGTNSQLGESCSESGYEQLTNGALVTMAYSLLGMYPLVTLVYVVRVSGLKKCCGVIWKRFRVQKLGTTMVSQMPSEGR